METLTSYGLKYVDQKISGGPHIEDGDRVSLLYRVALSLQDMEAGRTLESNYSPERPLEVIVSHDELLAGVYQGLLGMRAGGSVRRLFVPAELAYGRRGWNMIPADTALVVDILVRMVEKQSKPLCSTH